MKLQNSVAATLIFLCLLFSGPAAAQNNVTKNKWYGADTYWFCVEPVEIEYWIQTIGKFGQPDAAGGFHSVWQVTFHGTGEGLWSQSKYQYNHSISFTHVQNAAGGEIQTWMERIHVPSQGPLFNYHLWVDIHFTVTPDGTPIAEWYIIEPWCQGPV